MMISAKALAAASWGILVLSETRQSLYEAAMARVAFAGFLVSSLSLISIATSGGRDGGFVER